MNLFKKIMLWGSIGSLPLAFVLNRVPHIRSVGNGNPKKITVKKDNTVIDCSTKDYGKDPLRIIIKASNVTVRNCDNVHSIRTWGLGKNGESSDVRSSSRKGPEHIQRARDAAPKNTLIENVTFQAQGSIPLYVGPGTTYLTVRNSTFTGTTNSSTLYLDAESAHNQIVNNVFDMKQSGTLRELISVDASSYNLIEGNTFKNAIHGGIYLYRNCGERGTIRYNSPQHNVIKNNTFHILGMSPTNWGVWVGSRQGFRTYCFDDNGFKWGSSPLPFGNLDYAHHNTVRDNRFLGDLRGVFSVEFFMNNIGGNSHR